MVFDFVDQQLSAVVVIHTIEQNTEHFYQTGLILISFQFSQQSGIQAVDAMNARPSLVK